MDFPFDIALALREPLTVWDNKATAALPRTSTAVSYIREILDRMGVASGKAQGLPQPVTSYFRVAQSDHRVYVLREGNACVGILKVGLKKLFIRNELDVHKEIMPLCVLDFYVHESCQRTGYGRVLFEEMLIRENIVPWMLGYDRPSPKLLGFLRKHYQLSDFLPQANNFVVFKKHFEGVPAHANGRVSRADHPHASVSARPLTATAKRRASMDGGSRIQFDNSKMLERINLNNSNEGSPGGSRSAGADTTEPREVLHAEPSTPTRSLSRGYNMDASTNPYPASPSFSNGSRPADRMESAQQQHVSSKLAVNGFPRTSADSPSTSPMSSSPASSLSSPSRVTRYTHTPINAFSSVASPAPFKPQPFPATPPPVNKSRPRSPATMPHTSSVGSHMNLYTGHRNSDVDVFTYSNGVLKYSPDGANSQSAHSTPSLSLDRDVYEGDEYDLEHSNALNKSQGLPGKLGTLGALNSDMMRPMKFERPVMDKPHCVDPWKDDVMLHAHEDEGHTAKPLPYRLAASSRRSIGSVGQMSRNMQDATQTIEDHESRIGTLNTSGHKGMNSTLLSTPEDPEGYVPAAKRSVFAPSASSSPQLAAHSTPVGSFASNLTSTTPTRRAPSPFATRGRNPITGDLDDGYSLQDARSSPMSGSSSPFMSGYSSPGLRPPSPSPARPLSRTELIRNVQGDASTPIKPIRVHPNNRSHKLF